VGLPAPNLPIPAIPPAVHYRPVANNVDPTLSIPAALHVGADDTVTVPVNIDDAHPAGSTGLIRGQLALTYDPRLFTVSAADVHLGSVLAGGIGWTLGVSINQTTGEIAITFSSTTPISGPVGGSLVIIDLHAITSDASAAVPVALVASVNPTGQQVVTTELEDAQGTFTLTPALGS
jgi:Cohesin domain